MSQYILETAARYQQIAVRKHSEDSKTIAIVFNAVHLIKNDTRTTATCEQDERSQ
jgi:hypothetical protein